MWLNNLNNLQKYLSVSYGKNGKLDNYPVYLASGSIASFTYIYTPAGIMGYDKANLLTSTATSKVSSNGGGLYLGVGGSDTEVSVYDYNLGSQITTISSPANTSTWSETIDEGKCVRVQNINLDIKNTSSETIVIKEIGLYCRCNTGYNSSHYVLIYREVLEDPITLEASQTVNFQKEVTYTLMLPEVAVG